MFSELFQSRLNDGRYPNSFYKFSIIPIPKLNENTKKENKNKYNFVRSKPVLY